MKTNILIFLLFLQNTMWAQLTIGGNFGVAISKSVHADLITKNQIYELNSLQTRRFEIFIKYKVDDLWAVQVGAGALAMGFLTKYSQGQTPIQFYPYWPAGYPVHFYDYQKCGFHYFNAGTQFKLKKKLSVGLNLSYLWQKKYYSTTFSNNNWFKTDEETYFEREIYVNGLPYASTYQYKGTVSVDYLKKHQLAASISLNYTIYKGFKVQMEYLRGLQSYYEDLNKNKLYHQAISATVGYEYTFKKRKK